ncbi:DUF3891 family protein [Paenibacillus sepulcri]|uniref:DUF3891 family protein n=1 Tax=Paenibacillus sepulcri TaxID=359917 RepID=A0ABS7CE47_9BACL|nr:DUF3891 family protein [Paenibacillus sepulcri]
MIVYEKANAFVMINQHDHAQISGVLASEWNNEWLHDPKRKEDLIYAAYQHDRGWIDLDFSPFWNDARRCPYSFRDFPLKPRFAFYKKGIAEVAVKNPYSALLCSLLYTTLFERIRDEETQGYLNEEYIRQKRLLELLGIESALDARIQHHLGIMLVCDELSLFLCMEEPGTPAQEYEWFGSGVHYSAEPGSERKIQVHWQNKNVIELSLFPFRRDVAAALPYKEVSKLDIQAEGIIEAHRKAAQQVLNVTFTGPSQA